MNKGTLKNNQIALTLISAVVIQAMNVVISLVLPRTFIYVYGSDLNGVLSAARQFALYLLLMENSITAATCYQFIELDKKGDQDGIRNLYCTIGGFYKKISGIITLVALLFAFGYGFFSKSTVSVWTIVAIFLLQESNYVISYFIFFKYSFILYAKGFQYYISFSSVVSTTISFVCQLLLIKARASILLVLGIGVAIEILRCIVIRQKVRRDYPFLFEKAGISDESLLSQKWDSFVMSFSDSVKSMVPIVCMSVGYGTSYVSVFTVYNTVTHVGNSIVTMCLGGLLPVLGGDLTEKNEKAEKLYRNISVVIFAITSIISVCLCGMMLAFMGIYVKDSDVSYHYPLLSCLVVANAYLLMTRLPGDMVIKAFGRIRELRNQCIFEILITTVLCIAGTFLNRFEFIVVGVPVASLYRCLRIISFCHKEIGIDPNKPVMRDFWIWTAITIVFCAIALQVLPTELSLWSFIAVAAVLLLVVVVLTTAIVLLFYKDLRKALVEIVRSKLHRSK